MPPPPPVEAQNPFDQLFGDVASKDPPPTIGRSSSFDPADSQGRASLPLASAPVAPQQLQAPLVFGADASGAAGSAAHPLTAHPLTGSAGSHPLLASSGNGGPGVERQNPFDAFGAPPPSNFRPPSGHRAARRGHRATQSLGLPSDFSAMMMAPPAPPFGASAPPPPMVTSSPVPSVPENGSMNAEASAALKDLAASLAQAKPRALTETELEEEAKMLARVSLGEQPKESTGTKKTHRRKASMDSFRKSVTGVVKDSIHVMKGKQHHRKGSSMDARDMSSIVNDINDAGGGMKVTKSLKTNAFQSMSLTLTPKSMQSKRMFIDHTKLPGAPLTPGTPGSKKGKGGEKSPVPMSGASSVVSTNGDGLGGDVDSPVERGGLATVFSGLPGGEESARHLMTGAGALPAASPLDFPDLNGSGMLSAPPPTAATMVTATLGGTFATACSYAATSDMPAMRSSEAEPAPHQMDISPADDFLVHARACAVMDSYRVVDQNFDFGALVGMSRMGLEGFVNPVSVHDDDDDQDNISNSQGSDRGALVESAHRPIVASVLNCCDDMVVEGFFHELGGAGEKVKKGSDHGSSHGSKNKKAEDDTGIGRDKATDDRVEAAVFYSNRKRQFVVAWRGTTADQAKPVRNRHLRSWKEKWDKSKDKDHKDLCNLATADGKDCTVFPPYLESYLDSDLESRVFALLDELANRHTFCDVVMTGHSFGAALATLSAVRYASSHPMMRVVCQTFGSPKVGDETFARHWANSLPNLRTMRMEYGQDPWVSGPDGAPWTHAGHAIAVDAAAVAALAGEKQEGVDSKSSERGNKTPPVPARAYRFDQHRPGANEGWLDWAGSAVGVVPHHHGKEKADHELRSYVTALERISSLGLSWPREYVGEDVGKGVKGSGKEKRRVV